MVGFNNEWSMQITDEYILILCDKFKINFDKLFQTYDVGDETKLKNN